MTLDGTEPRCTTCGTLLQWHSDADLAACRVACSGRPAGTLDELEELYEAGDQKQCPTDEQVLEAVATLADAGIHQGEQYEELLAALPEHP